jgi:protein MpaA
MMKNSIFRPNKLIILSLLLAIYGCAEIQFLKKQKQEPTEQNKQTKVQQTEVTLTPGIYVTKTKENTEKVKKYCQKLDQYFAKYNWGESRCDDFTWHHVRNSHLGHPIIWYVFGDEERSKKEHLNTTMILCGVHGDEITPVKFCFDVLQDLKNKPELYKDKLVVVAPLVAPDSFLKKKPTRTNGRGVDVNRNFPTQDWAAKARKMWIGRYGKDIRRYPGKYALSEQETIFQVNLINRYKPQKVVSIHAPLTLLDYDGPAFSKDEGQVAKQLLIQMSDSAGKYKISNYPFFPGSLGNWAGNERRIPTYTLELPNSDWNKTDRYFKLFRTAIHHAITHDLRIHTIDEKVSDSGKDSTDKKEQID